MSISTILGPSTTRRMSVAAGAVALSLVLGACGAGPNGAQRTSGAPLQGSLVGSGPSGATIVIKDFAFGPGTLTVAPGTTVTVRNEDGTTHTLTSTAARFDTGAIAGGASSHFSAPRTPGSYPYRCNIHQYMTGTLLVRAG